MLWWDTDGLAIFYKRLERGNYQFLTDATVTRHDSNDDDAVVSRCEIRLDELSLLLAGIDLGSVKRRRRYRRPASNEPSVTDSQSASSA